MATGIRQRHRKSCNGRGRCDCTWQAEVFDADAGEKIRKTFPTYAAARGWRHDALVALREGRMRASTGVTLREAVASWLEGAETGRIRNRSGETYKPSAVRGYERALRLRLLPELGERRLAEVRRSDLQDLVDDLVAGDLSASTIQMTVVPLKAICRHEVQRGRLHVNPTDDLELPAVRSTRHRVAAPAEAARLLAALNEDDRPIWATAMYAGLRRGELMALRVDAIDLEANIIRVERGWDDKEGEIETKGRKRRRVPVPGALREHLVSHLLRSGRRGDSLVFGRGGHEPFRPARLSHTADAAWKAAGLTRITLHECRHTFASLMIAAGVNAKALSTYMGHANIAITLDLYGHLMPGNEDEAAGLLDSYLGRATG